MDRGTFFQALPFLAPVASSSSSEAWPPRISRATKTDVILKDHMISVEPKGMPACFESHDGVDPAMFHLDVCSITTTIVEEASPQQGKAVTSPAASSVSTSLSLSQSQSPKVPSQGTMRDAQDSKKQRERAHIVLRIDRKFVFQVDLAQFRGVELHETPSDDTVPNLVLRFDSCLFRIFSEKALDGGANAEQNSGRVLKSAASRLKRTVSSFEKLSIIRGNEDYLTPLDQSSSDGSSSFSTVQHGNRYPQVIHGSSDAKSQSESNEEGSCMRGMKRKRSALDHSWKTLHSLQDVLGMPRDAAQADDEVSETVAPLLTKAAEDLASSYCRKNDLRGAMQSCTSDIQSCEAQLNNVFTAAFPPPTRNRRTESPAKSIILPEENTEALLKTARMLLTKHKEAAKERLELSLLPTRN